MAPILDTLNLQPVEEAAVGLHAELYLLDYIFGGDVAGAKGEDDLAFRVVGEWHDFLGLPGDLIVFEGVGGRHALAVHHHELSVQVYADVHIVEPVLPFLIDLVLESELDVAAAHLPRIHEQKGYLLRRE